MAFDPPPPEHASKQLDAQPTGQVAITGQGSVKLPPPKGRPKKRSDRLGRRRAGDPFEHFDLLVREAVIAMPAVGFHLKPPGTDEACQGALDAVDAAT